MPREIVTLQLGNYSNYVGTHWWNIQEASFTYDSSAEPTEIDHDVMYREGQTNNGQTTFTPRMLLLDLKGTLKFMPEEGELYENNGSGNRTEDILNEIIWDRSKVEVITEKRAEMNEYQQDLSQPGQSGRKQDKDYDFKNSVKDWIDFSYSGYHPRSINIVNEYAHSKEENRFDTITNGMELWRKYDVQDEFTDKIRQYVEECDECQGFQVLFDCVDGFGGVAIKTLEYLQDEYGKSSLVFPVIPPATLNYKNADATMSASIRVINIALAFSELIECCSLFVPLSTMGRCWRDVDKPRSFPHISYEEANLYHTSALLATFLDTASLRYRMKNLSGESYLAGFCSDLSPYGRKMAAAGLSLPLPMHSSEDLIDFLDRSEKLFYTQLTPNAMIGTKYVVQSVVARGIPRSRLKRPPTSKSAQRQQRMAAYRCDSVSEMLQFYYQCQFHASMTHVMGCNASMDVMQPFPIDWFDSRVGPDGFLQEFDLGVKQNITSIPTHSLMQSSGDLSGTLDSLHREVSRIKLAKIPRFSEHGLEYENYRESLERLVEFKERYDDNYEI
ncbi:protein misato [Topomyia yanbarensis]|uniref:protein misato n=1 Tax=Topomyia yanbarensis TaxID=2498891 RepID=UPI00273A9767|nr:protein misato [Topomyia yanbarensis]XP_058813221.1 protein misato [Topomyia yanbarensis]